MWVLLTRTSSSPPVRQAFGLTTPSLGLQIDVTGTARGRVGRPDALIALLGELP